MASSTVTRVFATIGATVTLKATYDFASFLYFHFFNISKYRHYLYGDTPYALVTGATDGIGKAIARELYDKGFNLVLHGRNPEKLCRVQEEIQSSSSAKHAIRLWVADASAPEVDFASALKDWEDIEITLVIHNVGGSIVKATRMDAIPESVLLSDFRLNATFPWLLTRALLPKLRTARGPVELVFIGSVAGILPLPGLIPYGASKAFLQQLSAAISADERFRSPTNITTSYFLVGSVVTPGHIAKANLGTPYPERFAKRLVAKIGSGRSVVVPWVWHAVRLWMSGFFPESVLKKGLAHAAEEELKTNVKQA